MTRSKKGSVYPVGDKWKVAVWVDGLGGDRQRIYRTCRSKREAEMVKRELLLAEHKFPVENTITVSELIELWLNGESGSLKPKTVANYKHLSKKHIKPFVGDQSIVSFTPMKIQNWILRMQVADTGAVTIQRAKSVLQRALSYACKMQVLESNPAISVSVPQSKAAKQDPFTESEVSKICECPRYGLLYKLAFQTGMRQAEIFGLRMSAVDVESGTLRVVGQAVEVGGKLTLDVPPKTEAGSRIVPLSQEVSDGIAALKRKPSDLVFQTSRSTPIRYSGFRSRVWAKRLKQLGIKHRGMHQTRHTAATHMLRNGVPLHVVSKILGHSRPSITLNIYAHAVPEDYSAVRSVMGSVGKGTTKNAD